MVRTLIDLRRTMANNQRAHTPRAMLVVGIALLTCSTMATLIVGSADPSRDGAAAELLSFLGLLWLGGRVAQRAVSGEATLPPEMFAGLPIRRHRLAWSLLVVDLLDPANVFVAVALAGILVQGSRRGPAAFVTAVVALVLTVVLGSALCTVAAGLLAAGSRRGRDAATIVTAVAISVLAVLGTMLPALAAVLRDGSQPWLSTTLRALPTGWGPSAVEQAGRSNLLGAALGVTGLGVAIVLIALAWPLVLDRRMHGRVPTRRAPARRPRRRDRAAGPVRAVLRKELLMWGRDPVRLTCLVIALVVGTAVAIVPRVTAGTSILFPYAGTMTTVIAAACACNLFGNDGSSMWLTIMTPRAASADVVGRQLAWLLVIGPYALVSTVVLTAISGVANWPVALGLLLAAIGGGIGLVPLLSVVAVEPLDDAGNPTPAWSLKVHVALVVVAATTLPAVAAMVLGAPWLGLLVGAGSGIALTVGAGRSAARRLAAHQVAILRTLTFAAGSAERRDHDHGAI